MVVRVGNLRLELARELGWSHLAAVVVDKDDVEAVALAIAENRSGELAEWDPAILLDDLALLKERGILDTSGFIDADIETISRLLPSGDLHEDAPPAPPREPVARAGDVWELGRHRVVCGDASNRELVAQCLGRGEADMLLTDPPYGVSYVGKTRDALTIENDRSNERETASLIGWVFDLAEWACRAGAYWYATVPAGPLHLVFAGDWKRRGILRQILVWAKDSMVLGHSEYHYQHEPILFGWRPGGRLKNADRTRTTLWQCPRPKASRDHPTTKPVQLWGRAIADGSLEGGTIYDPFLGSGTTVIACEQLGRSCRGVEIDPAYVDVVVRRWQAATDQHATLEADGRTFAEVSAERLPAEIST